MCGIALISSHSEINDFITTITIIKMQSHVRKSDNIILNGITVHCYVTKISCVWFLSSDIINF